MINQTQKCLFCPTFSTCILIGCCYYDWLLIKMIYNTGLIIFQQQSSFNKQILCMLILIALQKSVDNSSNLQFLKNSETVCNISDSIERLVCIIIFKIDVRLEKILQIKIMILDIVYRFYLYSLPRILLRIMIVLIHLQIIMRNCWQVIYIIFLNFIHLTHLTL